MKNCHHFRFEAKRSETEAKNFHHFCFKVKWSKTEAKNCHHFRFEAKRKQHFFASMRKNCFFACFASKAKQKWNEAKTKQKRSETKKFLEAKQSKIYALFISLWSEAKNSKQKEAKKNTIFTWACETHAKRISFHFVLLWKKKNFFETGAPYWRFIPLINLSFNIFLLT